MKMYPVSRARLWLRSIVSGEKCISCGEFKTGGESLLCPACEDGLKRSHLKICDECRAYARDCLCVPHIMRESGIDVLVKYAFYDSATPEAALNRIISRFKRIPDGLAFAYFAAILSQPIGRIAAARGFTRENTAVTYIPRSKSGMAKDGYDQAELFARAVAKRSGFALSSLLRRVKHTKQQKYLKVNERIENVRGLFEVKNEKYIAGKRIILVDDLVTTGATVAEAAKMLYDAGAAEVVCVCLAKSERSAGSADRSVL